MTTPVVLVLYYSAGGSTAALAKQVARGVARAGGEAMLRTVPPVAPSTTETLPPEPPEGAPYATLEDLASCDALALGSPTRFGNMAAPMKYFSTRAVVFGCRARCETSLRGYSRAPRASTGARKARSYP